MKARLKPLVFECRQIVDAAELTSNNFIVGIGDWLLKLPQSGYEVPVPAEEFPLHYDLLDDEGNIIPQTLEGGDGDKGNHSAHTENQNGKT